jgi:hypothetical protein
VLLTQTPTAFLPLMMISDISLDGRSWLERRRDKKQVDKQGYTKVT